MNPLASEGGMKRTNILFRRFGIVRKNVGFPIFLFWAYLVKVNPEMRCAH